MRELVHEIVGGLDTTTLGKNPVDDRFRGAGWYDRQGLLGHVYIFQEVRLATLVRLFSVGGKIIPEITAQEPVSEIRLVISITPPGPASITDIHLRLRIQNI